jgi:hypothetical protein
VIFDIVENVIMEWTMTSDNVEKPNIQDMKEGVYPEEEKKRIVLLTSLPQSSIGQKRITELKNKTGKITE